MKNKILALAVSFLLIAGMPLAYAADDLQVPSDVENLVGYPGDGEAVLGWQMATDNVGVTGYKIYYGLESVDDDGGEYIFGPVSTGDTLSYTVSGLENNTTYYFVVTAVDAVGNESDYYSNEASVTPAGAATEDTTSPYILKATATNNMVVEVSFNEDIDLPVNVIPAFSIVSLETDEELGVLDAYLSDEDTSVVMVYTDTQEEGMSYQLTVGSSVTDVAGNPVVSGTADTAIFDGGAKAVPVAHEDTPDDEDVVADAEQDIEAPEINKVESVGLTQVVVTFNEEVILSEDEEVMPFEITLADDSSTVEILGISRDEEDMSIVILEVAELLPGEDYVLVANGIRDVAENELTNTFDRTANFSAEVVDIVDVIAPEDVTNFLASLSGEDSVILAWDASENTADDLADQYLYMSEDEGETYGDPEALGAETTSHMVAGLTAGQTYTFKLTVVDETGNENEGVITTITLPETGAGLGVIFLATALGTGYFVRKRK